MSEFSPEGVRKYSSGSHVAEPPSDNLRRIRNAAWGNRRWDSGWPVPACFVGSSIKKTGAKKPNERTFE
jgi:hypothetical protein